MRDKNLRGLYPLKRLLTVEETAQYLGLSPRTLYNRISRGAKDPFPVKPKRVGRAVRFDIRELDSYIDSLGFDPSGSLSTD